MGRRDGAPGVHHRQREPPGGEFRSREELRELVARRLEAKARELCTGDRWDELTLGVAHHRIDPWSAADEMLAAVDA
ncbi:MAG: hypothetical protein R2705_12215 [Ilumatobacteraceae bacterium]